MSNQKNQRFVKNIANGLNIYHPDLCEICGEQHKEVVEISRPHLVFFTVRINVCDSCIGKIFRSFDSKK